MKNIITPTTLKLPNIFVSNTICSETVTGLKKTRQDLAMSFNNAYEYIDNALSLHKLCF
jgi:predicted nucleic acid-binding protein